jgi:hypothetical protein
MYLNSEINIRQRSTQGRRNGVGNTALVAGPPRFLENVVTVCTP